MAADLSPSEHADAHLSSVLVDPGRARRCPFVGAVMDGRLADATQVALREPDPADPGVVPLLILWATRVKYGIPVPFGGHDD